MSSTKLCKLLFVFCVRLDCLSPNKTLLHAFAVGNGFTPMAGVFLTCWIRRVKPTRPTVDAFLTDIPWGIIPHCKHDVPISAVDVIQAVRLMISCFPLGPDNKPDGLIGIRTDVSPTQAHIWWEAMKAEGMYLSVIRVMDTHASSNSRACGNIHKPSDTTNGHQWMIGRTRYRGFHSKDVCGKCLRFVFLS